MMRGARKRPSPIEVIYDPSLIWDYGGLFDKSTAFVPRSDDFKIRSYVRFKFCNGVLLAYKTYNKIAPQPFQVIHRTCGNVTFPEVRPEAPGLNCKKAEDIISLLPFVQKKEDEDFLRNVCEKYVQKRVPRNKKKGSTKKTKKPAEKMRKTTNQAIKKAKIRTSTPKTTKRVTRQTAKSK